MRRGWIHSHQCCTALVLSCVVGQVFLPGFAESLFRASISRDAEAAITPSSLYSIPRPRHVGDTVTIQIQEAATMNNQAQLRVQRENTIEETGTGIFNGVVGQVLDKIPFLKNNAVTRLSDTLSVPSFDGVDNSMTVNSRADTIRQTRFNDNITCQVVQVLPNGFLLVQGKKTSFYNKERQDMYVTGIVNPMFVDRNNQIASSQVGNFQLMVGGKGVLSRQQNDGIGSKIYQFFN